MATQDRLSSATTESHDSEWLSREEAASLLGVSARRVLEFASGGQVGSKKERDPHHNQNVTRFNRADVLKLKAERETPPPAKPAAEQSGRPPSIWPCRRPPFFG
jgi:hypothetical protein